MKHSIKGLFVILTIVMSFVLVQGVWAETIKVEGTIVRIGTGSIDVDNNLGEIYTFYHIPLDRSIPLAVDDWVTIITYEVVFPNGETKYIPYSITIGETTYLWHPNEPKAGRTDSDSARTVSYDDADCACNGDCICDKCGDGPCDCLCECICDGDGPHGPKGPHNE